MSFGNYGKSKDIPEKEIAMYVRLYCEDLLSTSAISLRYGKPKEVIRAALRARGVKLRHSVGKGSDI
jgi:hypothetical protein